MLFRNFRNIRMNDEQNFRNVIVKLTSVAVKMIRNALQRIPQSFVKCDRSIQTTAINLKVQAGRYKVTAKRDRPLTYEMANPPHYIAHRKSWNSWNTSSLADGLRAAETSIEDIFIRRFMIGTWHGLVCSEVIIKRQFNHIRVAAIIYRGVPARKMYFLIGYTEDLLSAWLQCPVTLELQTVADKKDVIFKYI